MPTPKVGSQGLGLARRLQPGCHELDSGFRELPEGMAGNGFYIQRHNRSDDLFMSLARQMDELQPSTEYRVTIEIYPTTNVPEGLIGIRGSPGESVSVKAGASAIEPSQEQASSGWLRSTIDKGNQASVGTEMVVVGNISHSSVVGDHRCQRRRVADCRQRQRIRGPHGVVLLPGSATRWRLIRRPSWRRSQARLRTESGSR